VGFINTETIGCVASKVVRFVMAVMFQWIFSWKLPRETYARPAPSHYHPNIGKNGLQPGKPQRITSSETMVKVGNPRPGTAYGMLDTGK
jgi:hypothetical protein